MTLHLWAIIGIVAGALLSVGTILYGGVQLVLALSRALDAIHDAVSGVRDVSGAFSRFVSLTEHRLRIIEAHIGHLDRREGVDRRVSGMVESDLPREQPATRTPERKPS